MRETDYRRALSRQRKGTRSWLHGGQTDQCIRWDGVLQGYRAGTRVASCDLVGKHSEPLESASDHRGKNRQRGTDRAPSQSREDVGLGCLEGDPDGRRGHDETGGSRPGGNGHRFGDAGKSWGRTEQADRQRSGMDSALKGEPLKDFVCTVSILRLATQLLKGSLHGGRDCG